MTTPTMIMTGEADLRTPEEFHGWRRPSHQLLQQLYLMAWFEKYRTKESRTSVSAMDR